MAPCSSGNDWHGAAVRIALIWLVEPSPTTDEDYRPAHPHCAFWCVALLRQSHLPPAAFRHHYHGTRQQRTGRSPPLPVAPQIQADSLDIVRVAVRLLPFRPGRRQLDCCTVSLLTPALAPLLELPQVPAGYCRTGTVRAVRLHHSHRFAEVRKGIVPSLRIG